MVMRWRMVLAAGLVAVLGFAAVSLAAEMGMQAETQLKASIAEAKAAQAAGTLKEAQEHLQNVINCIEGPKGMMYKKMMGKMMSACEGKGSGLLPDAKMSGAKWTGSVPWIELAGSNAAIGVKAQSLAKARASGWAAQSVLEHAAGMMMK